MITTTCKHCNHEFDLDMATIKRGYSSWSRCPECRSAHAKRNRDQLDAGRRRQRERLNGHIAFREYPDD